MVNGPLSNAHCDLINHRYRARRQKIHSLIMEKIIKFFANDGHSLVFWILLEARQAGVISFKTAATQDRSFTSLSRSKSSTLIGVGSGVCRAVQALRVSPGSCSDHSR
jgi:hypothetical protein